jgi:glycosyltransferase involved in cell wall biosynthesis
MRVLHFYSTYFPDTFGGAENAIKQICDSTSRHGITSAVLTLSDNPSPKLISVGSHEVFRSKLNFSVASTRFSYEAVSDLANLSKSFDLVHYHFPWPFGDLCHFLAKVQNPYVVTYHSDVVKQRLLKIVYEPLMGRFLDRSRIIVATSPQYADSSPVLRHYRSKVRIVPLALSDRSDETASYPRELSVADWPEYFVFTGVLRYYKGLHLLIEAIRNTELKVIIVGDGPEREKLKLQASGMSNIRFLGALSECSKFALLKYARGFVFPSHLRSEAFGVSLIEASMMGLPLITFEIGTGTSYVNIDNVTGQTVKLDQESGSIQRLRDAMLELARNQDLAKKYGSAARARFLEKFSGIEQAISYKSVYQHALL